MIRRWHWATDGKMPSGPFVASARILDVPNTLKAAIMNAPPNCIAITIRLPTNDRTIADCERAARRKGLRIFWMRRRSASLTKDKP